MPTVYDILAEIDAEIQQEQERGKKIQDTMRRRREEAERQDRAKNGEKVQKRLQVDRRNEVHIPAPGVDGYVPSLERNVR